MLEPYERSLVDANRAARQEWAARVLHALDRVLPRRARIVLLAGERYSEFIVPALVAQGHQVDQPLKGLSLGRRLRFLGDPTSGLATRSMVEHGVTSGRYRWPAQSSSTDELSPLQSEHYEVAHTFEGFFDRADFLARYRELYAERRPGSIIPSDYCFNRENKGNRLHPRFLWWDGQHSYVFVGLHGAPKDFGPTWTPIAERLGHPDRTSDAQADVASPTKFPTEGLRTRTERARALAEHLHRIFLPSGEGIFGEHEMPEDILPTGLAAGSREQVLFLMLTVSVDYMRDASELWRTAREAWLGAGTRYLFEPETMVTAGYDQVERDLKDCGVSRKTRRDALAWFTIAGTLADKWSDNPRAFLEDCGYHAPTILRRLNDDKHLEHGRWRPDFPLLKGPKIAPLWIRMLRDNAGMEFSGLEEVPIPVDVHVLRATLCTGVLHGRFAGSTTEIFEEVRRVWREATRGLHLSDGRAMVALDVDEALWTLSRRGCSKRGNGSLRACPTDCPAAPGCVGGTVLIKDDRCEVNSNVSA